MSEIYRMLYLNIGMDGIVVNDPEISMFRFVEESVQHYFAHLKDKGLHIDIEIAQSMWEGKPENTFIVSIPLFPIDYTYESEKIDIAVTPLRDLCNRLNQDYIPYVFTNRHTVKFVGMSKKHDELPHISFDPEYFLYPKHTPNVQYRYFCGHCGSEDVRFETIVTANQGVVVRGINEHNYHDKQGQCPNCGAKSYSLIKLKRIKTT